MSVDPEIFVKAMKGGTPCRKCGLCCVVYVQKITEDDIIRHPDLKDVVVPNESDIKDDFPYLLGDPSTNIACPFYNLKIGCMIYKTRPDNCRDYKSSPFKCMSAVLTTGGLDVEVTVRRWEEEGIDEATILSRVYTQYLDYKKEILNNNNTYIIGGRSLEDDLRNDPLLKIIQSRIGKDGS